MTPKTVVFAHVSTADNVPLRMEGHPQLTTGNYHLTAGPDVRVVAGSARE